MPNEFHDTEFPLPIALGSTGGPSFRTDIVPLASGAERRIARWARSRRRFNAGVGLQRPGDVAAVIAFFEARQGRRYSFRFRDPFDHTTAPGRQPAANDCLIGIGDSSTMRFSLIKKYISGAQEVERVIGLPVVDSIKIAVGGVELTTSIDFSFDPLTREVVFETPPDVGATIAAGFIFDIEARFDTDELAISAEVGGGEIPDIPIVEVI